MNARRGTASISFLLVCQLFVGERGTALARDSQGRMLGESSQRPVSAVSQPHTIQETGYRVRAVYMIPANRSTQPNYEEKIQRFVQVMQSWFSDRMELSGFNPKTFVYESDADSTAPKVNVVQSALPDTYFHGDWWGRTLSEVASSGFPMWQPGEVVLVIAETQLQESDGSFRESSTFVGGASADFSGVGLVSGDFLARLSEDLLTDNRPYDGLVIPEIGPYRLVQDVSFPWFEGTTLSSVSSSAYGAAIHELSHGFGLWHDFRNDSNFNGNMMGNGLRGMRGALFPDLYPDDDTHLSAASALMLNYSRFFNAYQAFDDESRPEVTIRTPETVVPQHGLWGLSFVARDSESGLAGAVLIRDGEVVANRTLSGSAFDGRVLTYDYYPGRASDWVLLVLDRQGNVTVSSAGQVTCASGYNQAPHPFIVISKTGLDVGETVTLDASRSFDPDGAPSALKVQWDLDGDGTFDTAASSATTYRTAYRKSGVYQVIARLTDDRGDSAHSMPIGIRVTERIVRLNIDIKPGDERNIINPRQRGAIWVAVLSSQQFDALQLDVSSARFGPSEAQVTRYKASDVDENGIADLLLRFDVEQTGISCGAEKATLTAQSAHGLRIKGSSSIETVGCSRQK